MIVLFYSRIGLLHTKFLDDDIKYEYSTKKYFGIIFGLIKINF